VRHWSEKQPSKAAVSPSCRLRHRPLHGLIERCKRVVRQRMAGGGRVERRCLLVSQSLSVEGGNACCIPAHTTGARTCFIPTAS
jgi:hypothetical protein